MTTYEAVEPTSQVRIWDRKGKKELFVECPSALAIYNKSIGGVNLLDGLLSYYSIPIRSKKWYHCLIWHFLDVSVVQAWFLHRKDSDAVDNEKVTSLKEFKLSIDGSLLKKVKRQATKRGRHSILVEAAYSAEKKKGSAALNAFRITRVLVNIGKLEYMFKFNKTNNTRTTSLTSFQCLYC